MFPRQGAAESDQAKNRNEYCRNISSGWKMSTSRNSPIQKRNRNSNPKSKKKNQQQPMTTTTTITTIENVLKERVALFTTSRFQNEYFLFWNQFFFARARQSNAAVVFTSAAPSCLRAGSHLGGGGGSGGGGGGGGHRGAHTESILARAMLTSAPVSNPSSLSWSSLSFHS